MSIDVKYVLLALILATSATFADTEIQTEDRPRKPHSWKANVFVGSALLAVIAGIVVICLDGGTPNSTIENPPDDPCNPNHRCEHKHRHREHEEIL